MALDKVLKAVFGDRNERLLKTLRPIVAQVNELEPRFQAMSPDELGKGGLGREPIMADQLAHNGAVLLLDERAVVLLPGPAPREGDALPPAVVIQDAIDEFGAVVAVKAGQGHRQALAHGLHVGGDAIVPLPQSACRSIQLVATSTAHRVCR